jgi:hypothetical protein
MDLPEGYTEPNGEAYTKTEARNGPPLDYVAEKLGKCIESLHNLHQLAARDIPDGLPAPERFKSASYPYDLKASSVLNPCHEAFHYAVIAYLALNNLLGMSDNGLSERLLAMGPDDFKRWLEDIAREGSVT